VHSFEAGGAAVGVHSFKAGGSAAGVHCVETGARAAEENRAGVHCSALYYYYEYQSYVRAGSVEV